MGIPGVLTAESRVSGESLPVYRNDLSTRAVGPALAAGFDMHPGVLV